MHCDMSIVSGYPALSRKEAKWWSLLESTGSKVAVQLPLFAEQPLFGHSVAHLSWFRCYTVSQCIQWL